MPVLYTGSAVPKGYVTLPITNYVLNVWSYPYCKFCCSVASPLRLRIKMQIIQLDSHDGRQMGVQDPYEQTKGQICRMASTTAQG